MMKKICSLVLFSALIIGMTGCGSSNSMNNNSGEGNNSHSDNEQKLDIINKNTLSCSSDSTSVMTDIYITGHSYSEDQEDFEDLSISFGIGNEDLENGEYSFIYNDDGLISIEGKEVYKKSFSNQVTDEMIDELNKQEQIKAYKKNGKLFIEYTLKEDDKLVKVLCAHYKTKKELKKFLEEGTFTCK